MFNIQHILVRKLKFAKIKINRNSCNVIEINWCCIKTELQLKNINLCTEPSICGYEETGTDLEAGIMTVHVSVVHITAQFRVALVLCAL